MSGEGLCSRFNRPEEKRLSQRPVEMRSSEVDDTPGEDCGDGGGSGGGGGSVGDRGSENCCERIPSMFALFDVIWLSFPLLSSLLSEVCNSGSCFLTRLVSDALREVAALP